ncbi:alpha/beta-hydrolase [Cadophora sp. DSE1049]|nr:alpha/beta-hydrolase [Cadophora sp. DSE1049]
MPSITLPNGQTDYYEVDDYTDPWNKDDADVVIFQPGILRHTEFVFHVVPLMAHNVRFIRRDLRGHGRSSIGDAAGYQYTLDTLVDEMAEFVDQVVGRPVHWIGESTAGMLALAFAKKYPAKLKSVIIMSSPLFLNDAFIKMVSQPYKSQGEALRKMGTLDWSRSRPISNLGTNQKKADTNDMGRFKGPEYLKWYEEMLVRNDLGGLVLFCDFVATINVSAGLEDIKVPSLIMAPRNSFASPVSLNEEMAQRIPDSRLVVIESVGHMIYVDEPEATCNAILQWVKDLRSRKTS